MNLFSKNIIIWIVFLYLSSAKTENTFIVEFQSSGKWTKDETVEYQGDIPELNEFTSCHWQKDKYFAVASTVIWSYCFSQNKTNPNWNCVQLHYRGNKSVANRDVIFGGFFYGWTEDPINIVLNVKNFRHRTWNHICWAYSSYSGNSSLIINGKLVADGKMPPSTKYPKIPPTETTVKHLLLIGQVPDIFSEDPSEDHAFFGSISEFNLWDVHLRPSSVEAAANCKTLFKGNVVAWQKKNFLVKNALIKETKSISQFCSYEMMHVVFHKSQSFQSANETCHAHGGTIIVPKSEPEHRQIIEIMEDHVKTCIPKNRANSNAGKLIWLGLKHYEQDWYEPKFGNINYTNWGSNYIRKSGRDKECAFVRTDGTWGYLGGDECLAMTLCFICSIPRSTVFTLKGYCEKGSVFQWNYYPYVNETNQISYYEGYKRGQGIYNKNGKWVSEVEGAKIELQNAIGPLGRNQWKWYERSCGTTELQDRNMTLSLCVIGEEFTCDSGHCINLNKRCDRKKDCWDGSDEKLCTHIYVPEEYDKMIPQEIRIPEEWEEGKEKTELECLKGVWINLRLEIDTINHVDAKDMNIQVSFKLNVIWKDERLIFKNLNQKGENFKISDEEDLGRIWLPIDNIDYENAVIGKIHKDSNKDVEILVTWEGERILHPLPVDVSNMLEEYKFDTTHPFKSAWLQMRQGFRIDFNCTFNLKLYPFDEQFCNIIMRLKSSRNYNVSVILDEDAIRYRPLTIANQYHLVDATSNISLTTSSKSNHSDPCFERLKTNDGFLFTLHLKRNSDHQVKTLFIPCIGLWVVAYFTVLLRVDDFTNRNRISVTVLLAMVTLFVGTANTDEYPKTTYLKNIDAWFLFYLTSIFLIISHHMVVEMLWHDPSKIDPHLQNLTTYTGNDRLSQREKLTNQRKLNRIMTFFFPISLVIFNFIYFQIMH